MSKSWDNEFGDKNNLETGLKWDWKKFFNDWNHQYQLEIIAVYHNVQNEQANSGPARSGEMRGDEEW